MRRLPSTLVLAILTLFGVSSEAVSTETLQGAIRGAITIAIPMPSTPQSTLRVISDLLVLPIVLLARLRDIRTAADRITDNYSAA